MQGKWKNKLEHWAPEPPAGVWDRISDELSEASQPLFAQKLQNFSEAPPANTWNVISAQLAAPAATPVIRLFSKNKIFRYGSVAASLLFCFFLFRALSVDDKRTGSRAGKILREQTIIPLPNEVGNLRISKILHPDKTAQQQPVAATTSAFAFLPKSTSLPFDKDPMPTIPAERTSTIETYKVTPAAMPRLNNSYVERYMVMHIAEDVAVRLPKKLYDLFRCGDVPASSGCSELMIQIRQQSASPSFVATADFPGLLGLMQQAEQRQ